MFNLPLSQEAFDQMMSIQQIMAGTHLGDDYDVWSYSGGSVKFKSAAAYKKLLGHQEIDPAFKWIWKSYCQPKHKVFCWLLLKDRLSTRNILRRRKMELESYSCEICSLLIEETVEHLFWNCPFAQQCWGILNLETVPNEDSFENIRAIKDQLHSQFFTVAVVLMR